MKIKLRVFYLAVLVLTISLPIELHAEGRNRVEIKDGWFYVNREKFFVKGVCYFEAHDVEGRYEQNSPEILDYEFKRIKEAGFNTIRTFLTPEKIEIAEKYGLMIMQDADRLCFSDEYKDPAKISRLKANIDEIVGFSKRYDSILFYAIDNEPNVKAIYRQGEKAAADMWRILSEKVRQVQPGAFTTICIMPPDAFADISMCDVVSLNLYPWNPARNSIGYTAYADWYSRSHAKNKVFLISEYGWTDDLKEFSPVMMKLLDEQIKSGASGSFFFTWRAWHKEKEKDSQWWGIIPNNGKPDGYKNEPRPIYYDYQNYFEAVAIEPRSGGVYAKKLPLEIYGTDKTGSIEAKCGGKKINLKKQGKYWWLGKMDFGPASYGEKTVTIESKDKSGRALVKKEINVFLCAEKKSLTVKILRDKKQLISGKSYEAKIIVVDEKGKRVPNQPLLLGVNQSMIDEWTSLPRKGSTDSNGEYFFKEENLVPGYFTLMAGVDTQRKNIETLSDVDISRVED